MIQKPNFHNWIEFTVHPAILRLPHNIQIFYLIFFGPELIVFGTIFGI